MISIFIVAAFIDVLIIGNDLYSTQLRSEIAFVNFDANEADAIEVNWIESEANRA